MQKGIVQDTIEKLGELAKDSGKSVVSEPAKILEQVLGGDPSEDSGQVISGQEQGVSDGSSSQKKQSQADPLTVKKKQEDQKRVQDLLALHRQRLREAEAFAEKTEQEDEQKEMMEEREEDEREQNRIVQLRKQEAKDAVLAPVAAKGSAPGPMTSVKKKMGSKELGRQKD